MDAWNVFVACSSQWQIAAGFERWRWLGLNYQGVEVVRRAQRISDERWSSGVFDQLQVLEEEEVRLRNG